MPTYLLRTRRDSLLRFVEGLIEGIYVFKTNRDLALSMLKQEGVKGPEYSYPRIAAALRERPVPEIKGVQAVMDSIKSIKSKVTQAKDVIDGTLVEEIDKNGYVAKLYGK